MTRSMIRVTACRNGSLIWSKTTTISGVLFLIAVGLFFVEGSHAGDCGGYPFMPREVCFHPTAVGMELLATGESKIYVDNLTAQQDSLMEAKLEAKSTLARFLNNWDGLYLSLEARDKKTSREQGKWFCFQPERPKQNFHLESILVGVVQVGECYTKAKKVMVSVKIRSETVAKAKAIISAIRKGDTEYRQGDYFTALQYWRPVAEKGVPEIQFRIGDMYDNGQGVSRDVAEAARWYARAGTRGHIEAQYRLGKMYQDGRGVDRNTFEAKKRYGVAAEAGHTSAQYRLATFYRVGKGVPKDAAEAFGWYQRAANEDHGPAQYWLGVLYEFGLGVGVDLDTATGWYQRAAESLKQAADREDAEAQFLLGEMLLRARGIPEDKPEAMKWFLKAARQEHGEAQYRLAMLYHNGWGVDQNIAKAVGWYTAAAQLGHEKAQYRLAEMFRKGDVIEKDYAEAARWYRLVAESSHARSQYLLGKMYEKGLGVDRNAIQAVRWYRAAAEQGHSEALYSLGTIYARGSGSVKEDTALAWAYFKTSAELGLKRAEGMAEKLHNDLSPSQLVKAEKTKEAIQNLISTQIDVSGVSSSG